jgi:hypothetical protein
LFGTSVGGSSAPAVFSPIPAQGAIEIISGDGTGRPKLLALVTDPSILAPATLQAADALFQDGRWNVPELVGRVVFWSGWNAAIVDGKLVLRIKLPLPTIGWGLQGDGGRAIVTYNGT